jgi:hypothetical protein
VGGSAWRVHWRLFFASAGNETPLVTLMKLLFFIWPSGFDDAFSKLFVNTVRNLIVPILDEVVRLSPVAAESTLEGSTHLPISSA